MAQRLTIGFEGEKKLFRVLARMEKKFQKKATRKAMRQAAKPLRKKMRSLAPKSSGLLKVSIATKIVYYRRTQTVVAVVGARSEIKGKKATEIAGAKNRLAKPSRYVHLVESPTKPHTIAPKGEGGVLAVGGNLVRKPIQHPGTKGTRFTQRSLQATRQASITAMADSLRDSIRAEARAG